MTDKTWTGSFEQDENGELVLVIPPEVLEHLGWETGEPVVWGIEYNQNGPKAYLRRATNHEIANDE